MPYLENLNELLNTYNLGETVILGKNTQAFSEQLHKSSTKNKTPSLFDIFQMREQVSAALKTGMIPYPDHISEKSYQEMQIGLLTCQVLRCANHKNAPTLVMFFGGGFCLNTLIAHKSFMAHVAEKISCNIIFPLCPLAPEFKAPEIIAAADDFMLALTSNLEYLEFSNNICLLGWSSGGNLALTAALNLQKNSPKNFKKISKIIALSSWMDLTMRTLHECPYQKQQAGDTIAAGDVPLTAMSKHYIPDDSSPENYSPSYRPNEELKNLPPVFLIAGSSEVILGDTILMTHVLRHAGTPATLIVVEGQTHNYLVFDQLSKDGVFVPDVIANIIEGKDVENMRGDDNLSLQIQCFNTRC